MDGASLSGYGPVTRQLTGAAAGLGPYDPLVGGQGSLSEEITTLWIGNVLPGTTDADMATAFSRYGNMVCCFLLKKLSPQGHLSGFVRYTTVLEASCALEAVQCGQVIVRNSTVSAKWASTNSKPLGSTPGGPSSMVATTGIGVETTPATSPDGPTTERVANLILEVIKSTQTMPSPSPSQPFMHAPSPQITTSAEDITTLWVGNILPGTTNEDMSAVFSLYGHLLACFTLKSLSPQGQMSGFVRYTTRQEAAVVLQAIENESVAIRGSIIRGKWATENSNISKKLGGESPHARIGQNRTLGVSHSGPPHLGGLQAQSLHLGSLQTASLQAMPQDLRLGLARTGSIQSVPQYSHLGLLQTGSIQTTPQNFGSLAGAPQNTYGQESGRLQTEADDEEITTLWVGNVPPGTSDQQMATFFKPFGNLVCCFLLKKLSKQGQLSGFVRFTHRSEASAALEAIMQGIILINGAVVTSKWARQNSKPLSNPDALAAKQLHTDATTGNLHMDVLQPPANLANGEEITTLWLGNALPGTSDTDLRVALSQYGSLVCCFLLKKISPQGQLSGFARYTSQIEAQMALEAIISGRIIVNNSVITAKWASHNSKAQGTVGQEAPNAHDVQALLMSLGRDSTSE